jgi:threonine/homoserine/homoserine lactone efflux protein
MGIGFFLTGIFLGFLTVAPFLMAALVGSAGVFCVRRTLKYGRLSGFFSGLGIACVAGICALVVTVIFSFFSETAPSGLISYRLIDVIPFLILGEHLFFRKLYKESKETSHKTVFKDFCSAFSLAIKNPVTILACVAIILGLYSVRGSVVIGGALEIFTFILGVFWGALAWCLFASETSLFFRKKANENTMIWMNRITGIAIFAFGVITSLILIQ